MINDLGRMNVISSFFVKLGLVAGVLGVVVFVCIALAIAVRIGNAIIGF